MVEVRHYRPGELPETTRPGDFLLVHSPYLISRFIRLATGSHYNHAAFVVGERGEIVEALAKGVVRRNVREWEDVSFAVVSPPYSSEENRRDAVAHAEWMAGEGFTYDWATIFGMALFWCSRGKLMISGGAKVAICSAAVADALHAGAQRFAEKIPHFMTPEDLRENYGVKDAEYE